MSIHLCTIAVLLTKHIPPRHHLLNPIVRVAVHRGHSTAMPLQPPPTLMPQALKVSSPPTSPYFASAALSASSCDPFDTPTLSGLHLTVINIGPWVVFKSIILTYQYRILSRLSFETSEVCVLYFNHHRTFYVTTNRKFQIPRYFPVFFVMM